MVARRGSPSIYHQPRAITMSIACRDLTHAPTLPEKASWRVAENRALSRAWSVTGQKGLAQVRKRGWKPWPRPLSSLKKPSEWKRSVNDLCLPLHSWKSPFPMASWPLSGLANWDRSHVTPSCRAPGLIQTGRSHGVVQDKRRQSGSLLAKLGQIAPRPIPGHGLARIVGVE